MARISQATLGNKLVPNGPDTVTKKHLKCSSEAVSVSFLKVLFSVELIYLSPTHSLIAICPIRSRYTLQEDML